MRLGQLLNSDYYVKEITASKIKQQSLYFYTINVG